MLEKTKDDGDNDPTMEQEFFIGGWDPYLVEITRLKRDQSESVHSRPGADRRSKDDRRKG